MGPEIKKKRKEKKFKRMRSKGLDGQQTKRKIGKERRR